MKEEKKRKTYHIAINEVDIFKFGIKPAKNTRTSIAQTSKLAEDQFKH